MSARPRPSNRPLTVSPWEGFLPRHALLMARRAHATQAGAPPVITPAPAGSPAPLSPAVAAPAPAASTGDSLGQITEQLQGCNRCKLSQGRQAVVIGEGNPHAALMFVGEGPGEQEDLEGRPFVGKAGQLLDKMIQAMGLRREDVFIANVVKCRPPGNRNPEPDEIAACSAFLERQIDAVKPKVIVALGKFAAQTLLATEVPISQLRGKFHSYRGAKLMPTFHPAYLLRNPASKREAWSDLLQVVSELGLVPPKPGS